MSLLGLFNDAFRVSESHVMSHQMLGLLANRERKTLWPSLKYYHVTFPEGLRETSKNLIQNSRSQGQDLMPGPSE